MFITSCPLDYEQNDDDCDGMYEMFAEQGLPFEKHCVIDKRTEPDMAKDLVKNADCIFLMGDEEKTEISRYSEDMGPPYEFIKFSGYTFDIKM